MVSIGRIVRVICYLGGVCDFHNQLQTSITAKTNLSAYKKAVANMKAGVSTLTGTFA